MSSSKNIIRSGASLPAYTSRMRTVEAEQKRMEDLNQKVDPSAELQKLRQEARDEGYRDGLQQGRQDGLAIGIQEGRADGFAAFREETEEELAKQRSATEAFAQKLEAFADSAFQAVREWKAEAEEAHAMIAIEIAERAVRQELSLSRESVVALAKEALAELHQGLEFRVLVNPSDVGEIEGRQKDILEALTHVRGIEVVADGSIKAGCMVESHSGAIDARIETYLQRIAEAALEGRAA